MQKITPLTELQRNKTFGPGDTIVICGEIFNRGYVSGFLDAAKSAGMNVIGLTMGRREADGSLRPLTDEELALAEENIGGRIINIPVMSGFDLDAPPGRKTPSEMINEMSLKDWQERKLDSLALLDCRSTGQMRFRAALDAAMSEIDALLPAGKNVIFAHIMAGGIPRSKTVLALVNRIYKGRGARHMASADLMKSDLGQLILKNFDEVTAMSFRHLIGISGMVRERIEASGGKVYYTAYGYHGTRVMIGGEYRWQSYVSYTQGHAKMHLEQIAREARERGIKATVFNCPETMSASSSIFAGLELSILPLLTALRHEGGGAWVDSLWAEAEALLKDDVSVEQVLDLVSDYQQHPDMQPFYDYAAWPMENSAAQAEQTIGTSEIIAALHRDEKNHISGLLSPYIVQATGQMIFDTIGDTDAPVLWLDHDMVAKQILALN